MFATMTTVSEPNDFFGKLKYNLLPPPVKVQTIHPPAGNDFVHLTVPVIRGKIYWNNVAQAAGRAAKNMLPPSGFTWEDGVRLQRFTPDRFLGRVTVNSFFHLLRLLPRRRLLEECAVLDYGGSYASMLEALPRYCRNVLIITANEEKYSRFAHQAMEEYGCAVCVSLDITKAFHVATALLPAAPEHATAFSKESRIFAPRSNNIYAAHVYTPEGVSLPEDYLKIMPTGIASSTFAAALFEESGVSALGSALCPAFREGRHLLSYREVLAQLAQLE